MDKKVAGKKEIGIKSLKGEDKVLFDSLKDPLEIIRHSAAHLMAHAIKELYPNAKFYVGPVIEDGFFYDFETDTKVGESDLKSIEKKMMEIAKKNIPIIRYEISKDDAKRKYEKDYLKLKVLENINEDKVSIYKQGNFEDLCRGPHLINTKHLRYFKLLKISGAYIDQNDSSMVLTRIYGTAFRNKKALKEHLTFLEEAKKRDHKTIAKQLKLFMVDKDIGSGLPVWLPNGARLKYKLEDMLRGYLNKRDYLEVRGPSLLKSDIWKVSGHYENFKDNMYFTKIENFEYGIKPMNCLSHIKIYQNEIRSYRDLPLKLFEYGIVHRHEKSGVLNGLLRLREFTQDDAHIFCRQDQIETNIIEIFDFVKKIMGFFKFDYEVFVSTRPEKAIGDKYIWDEATNILKKSLDKNKTPYKIDADGGAFYGPKIDIKITDSIKRKWQCSTIQLDFNLPERFNLTYIDKDNEKKRVVMIHRAILGSFERFIGILLEHTKGEIPFLISPKQIIIIPIDKRHEEHAYSMQKKLAKIGVDAFMFNKSESLSKRVRLAESQKPSFVILIGDNEINNKSVSVRDRLNKKRYEMSVDDFLNSMEDKLDEGNF